MFETDTLSLNSAERQRYQRHIQLQGFGEGAQLRLKSSRVLLIGAGGLGCPVGLYLAAAGVGKIGIIDFDKVALSNLQRQIAHRTEDVGISKVQSLVKRMRDLNPLPEYASYPERLTVDNVFSVLENYDLVIDGSDNYATRYLVADACYFLKKPFLTAAVEAYRLQLARFIPGEGEPCFRCLFPYPPAQAAGNCSELGVLGVLPGLAGLILATEAIKHLVQNLDTLHRTLMTWDVLTHQSRLLKLNQDENCPLCGVNPVIQVLRAENVILCNLKEPSPMNATVLEVDAVEFSKVAQQPIPVWDVRESFEYAGGHWPGALNVPLSDIEAGSEPAMDLSQPIGVYCLRGMRSLKAARFLSDKGFQTIYTLQDGLEAWPEIDLVVPPEAAL